MKQLKYLFDEFGRQLKENNIPVDFLVLFGSYAKGNSHEDSDLDIAVISPDFGKNRLFERIRLLNISSKIDSRIEPHPISTKDWKEGWKEIVYEINKTGIRIPVNL
ncbi:MAG TPA: nucleotidyltransferase domain-containing protein [Candidatus Kapabacteria bacterium]|nr:nucleotidyltransferase domain-containing protein [Candidatus Kapabacteria bacterium]